MTDNNSSSANRVERALAFMIASIVGLSILAFLAIIIATAMGVRDFGVGIWPVLYILPGIGLPIGFILIIVLLIVGARRRSREARERK